MEVATFFLFKIVIPMIWLGLFAYAFVFSALKLVESWKRKKMLYVWLYTWIILVGLYFLIKGGDTLSLPCR